MFRIHRNHMSHALSEQLYKEVHNVSTWEDSDHLWFKKEDRNISSDQIKQVLKEGRVIEYNLENNMRRVLLKDDEGICVVVDLDTHHVITTFTDAQSNGKINPKKYIFGLG